MSQSARGVAAAGVLAAVTAVLAGLFVGAVPVDAALPGGNGRIAFVSNRDGNEEVYVMTSQGTAQNNVTSFRTADFEPAWRATGGEFVFTRNTGERTEIWRSNASGSEILVALRVTTNASSPAWSRFGTLAFETDLHGGYEIFITDTKGNAKRLTTNDPISDRAPVWSPDGKRIAFWSARDRNRNIYVMNVDGSNQQRLTDHQASDRDPDWSPDGETLVFNSSRNGNGEIYVMDATGGEHSRIFRNLTNHPANDRQPVFSPKGDKIAFVSDRDGNDEIYVMQASGTGVTRLTFNPASDTQPDWEPVGGVETGSDGGSGGLTTGGVVAGVAGGTVAAVGTALILCGGVIFPAVGELLFGPCALAISVAVEGGTVVLLERSRRNVVGLRPAESRARGARAARSYLTVAMPFTFPTRAVPPRVCTLLSRQTACGELRRAVQRFQTADSAVASMMEGAAITSKRFYAAREAASAGGQALQRAAGKVYWIALSYRLGRKEAAGRALAALLQRERVNFRLTAAQASAVKADLASLRGVPSSALHDFGHAARRPLRSGTRSAARSRWLRTQVWICSVSSGAPRRSALSCERSGRRRFPRSA